MKFIDEARIAVAAGNGGDGCVAFLREKYRPHGGPAGGDGGDGGSVLLCADPRLRSLLDFRYKRRFRAEPGAQGSGKGRHGAAAADLVLAVPPGTVVFDAQTDQILADLVDDDARVIVALGGRGGRGNARFATPTHQAPRRADPGEPGEVRELRLEIRLLANCGLLGLPNAGKSSFLARVSAARPKIADYPFTTLAPVLGVVRSGETESFVLADIPGLVEGAHEGVGLGLRFLTHLRRTEVLAHLIDSSDKSIDACMDAYDTINRELASFDSELAAKPQLVVATKSDLSEVRDGLGELERRFAKRGLSLHAVSAATGQGCERLLTALFACLSQQQRSVHTEDTGREHSER